MASRITANRRQFGLRALLAATVASALLTWWLIQPPKSMITDRQAVKIKAGMTLDEVQSVLAGSMCEVGLTYRGPYLYRIYRPFAKDGELVLYHDAKSARIDEVVIR